MICAESFEKQKLLPKTYVNIIVCILETTVFSLKCIKSSDNSKRKHYKRAFALIKIGVVSQNCRSPGQNDIP